jgi:uncharacterized protein YxjI
MRYVMKEKILTLTDSFTIRDSDGNEVYRVKGKLLSIGDKLSFRDMAGEELALIRQEIITLTPSYRIYRGGELQADVSKKLLTVFRDKFKVDMKDGSPDLEIVGNILDHEYSLRRGGREVAHVSKKWISIGDSYGVQVDEGEDDVLILACAVIVDLISHEPEDRPQPRGKGAS